MTISKDLVAFLNRSRNQSSKVTWSRTDSGYGVNLPDSAMGCRQMIDNLENAL
jgi:hypothetical protein